MRTILVTGAEGFLGRGLCARLEREFRVRRAVRAAPAGAAGDTVVTGDLATFGGWDEVVSGVDTVMHLAGRAHIIARDVPQDLASFTPVNVHATRRLAVAATALGVRRFVFVSSIGVNGNETPAHPFTERDAPAPVEAYAVSKWQAEQELRELFSQRGPELVVVRPPLVYGPGVKGNLWRLLKLISKGWPLPLGALRAPRSFIGRDNLCDLLAACIDHPHAAGELFLAAEPERQSTSSMVEAMAARMPRAGGVWRVPLPLLNAAAALAGRRAELNKLAGSLSVDPGKACDVLGWKPALSFEAGVNQMVDAFVQGGGG
jgi:nucleoside-diphosphate-sugar epimerase